MKYEINQTVYTVKNNEHKIIKSFKEINNSKFYIMYDYTIYEESEIVIWNEDYWVNRICSDNRRLDEIIRQAAKNAVTYFNSVK